MSAIPRHLKKLHAEESLKLHARLEAYRNGDGGHFNYIISLKYKFMSIDYTKIIFFFSKWFYFYIFLNVNLFMAHSVVK